MSTKQVVRLTREQVEAAQSLVRIAGGADKVNPVIAQMASAQPARSGNGGAPADTAAAG